jgi:sugar (pentulose or hexulose) kinase
MSIPLRARPIVIGLDIGTARIKALGLGLDGEELADAERPTPWTRDGSQAEMDPGELANIVRETISSVPLEIERADGHRVQVVGIGVAGMGEAGVLADPRGRPLARILAWHDPRGDVELVRQEVGDAAFQRAVGMPLNAQPSLAKILWLRRSADTAACAVRFLSLPEWGVCCLGGTAVSELSLASRTGLLDIGELAPFEGAVALLGRNLLSELVHAGSAAGVASGASLPASVRGAVLTVAGHDHQAAALAVGAARPGALFNSLGTAEALVRCVDGPLDPTVVGRLAAQGTTVGWGVARGCSTVQEGLRTGLVLERLAALLGAHDRSSRRLLGEQALAVDLAGIPHDVIVSDAETRPTLARFADGLSAPAIWAAAVRDLTAASARRLERIETEIGPHSHVTAAGGWTRNAALLAAKRLQFGELEISELREAGATGAALLAGIAAGVVESPETDAAPVWPECRVPRANSEVS